MSLNRQRTALICGFAVVALVFTATAWAQSQQSSVVVRHRAQDDQERASARLVRDFSILPTFTLSGSLSRRSVGIAGRVLSNAEELGLSDDQEEQVRQLQRENRRTEIRRNADTQIAEMDLEELMSIESSDLNSIEQKMREIANYQVDARMARLRLDRGVEAILTAEQRDALEEMSDGRVIFETLRR